jgi:hypothetical protein
MTITSVSQTTLFSLVPGFILSPGPTRSWQYITRCASALLPVAGEIAGAIKEERQPFFSGEKNQRTFDDTL